jgi:glyoxylase-like metal-dependent hydrolase (beta-lactamase superfamily II)
MIGVAPNPPLMRPLLRSLLVALSLATPDATSLGAQSSAALQMVIRTVAPRVYVISGYTNGNLLAVDRDDGVLLVDTQSARRVALADSALRTMTTRPVRWIVLTHYHDDHLEGVPYWRARGATTVVAQANVVPRARRDTSMATYGDDVWHHRPAADSALPTRTFVDSLTLRLGDEPVELLHIADAHTDGDAIVRLPRRNVVHVGDIVEVGDAPFLDRWGGGTLDGMIRGVDRIVALTNDSTVIVPGHGEPITRAALARYRAALVATRERVREALAAHADPGDGATLVPVDYLDVLGGPSHARRFARIAYDAQRAGAR